MAMPQGLPVVDLMVALPASDEDKKGWYEFIKWMLLTSNWPLPFSIALVR